MEKKKKHQEGKTVELFCLEINQDFYLFQKNSKVVGFICFKSVYGYMSLISLCSIDEHLSV